MSTTRAGADRADEDARFNAWLLTRDGAAVTRVPGDRHWNLTAARTATDKITGKSK